MTAGGMSLDAWDAAGRPSRQRPSRWRAFPKYCQACGFALGELPALAGETTHPTCDPTFAQLI